MLDRKKVIEVNGVSYPIVFNLNVMEIIQEKYGSIDAWSDKLTSDQAIADIKWLYRDWETDRKSTRLNSSHSAKSRMPSSA